MELSLVREQNVVLKRLLGLGSKRLRALTVLGAAGKALTRGRPLRGIGLVVVAALAQLLVGTLGCDDSDEPFLGRVRSPSTVARTV